MPPSLFLVCFYSWCCRRFPSSIIIHQEITFTHLFFHHFEYQTSFCRSLCLVICIVSELKLCVCRIPHTHTLSSYYHPSSVSNSFVIRPSLCQHLMSIRLTSLWTLQRLAIELWWQIDAPDRTLQMNVSDGAQYHTVCTTSRLKTQSQQHRLIFRKQNASCCCLSLETCACFLHFNFLSFSIYCLVLWFEYRRSSLYVWK